MRKQVMEILPKSKDRLKVLYDIITRDGKAWMKAIRVPDVSAVEKAKTEMYEAYPEFSARSLETPERAQISDDAGFDPAPIFEQLRKKMQERKERIQK
jgi:hypothetical protein